MKRIVVIEALTPREAKDSVYYRWTCARCGAVGAVCVKLNDAETDGARHDRVAHCEIPRPNA